MAPFPPSNPVKALPEELLPQLCRSAPAPNRERLPVQRLVRASHFKPCFQGKTAQSQSLVPLPQAFPANRNSTQTTQQLTEKDRNGERAVRRLRAAHPSKSSFCEGGKGACRFQWSITWEYQSQLTKHGRAWPMRRFCSQNQETVEKSS